MLLTYAVNLMLVWSLAIGDEVAGQSSGGGQPIGWINGKPVSAEGFTLTKSAEEDYIFVKRGRAPAAADQPEIERERQMHVCNRWGREFWRTVVKEAEQRYGITVTEAELLDFKKNFPELHDYAAHAARVREEGIRLRTALEQVYLQGKDPQQVYLSLLQPSGVPEQAWKLWLFQGREEPRRSQLTRWKIEMTPEKYAASVERSDLGVLIRKDKLRLRVAEEAKGQGKLSRQANRAEEEAYLEKWIQEQYRHLKVTLSDPEVAKSCGFARLGIVVPGSAE